MCKLGVGNIKTDVSCCPSVQASWDAEAHTDREVCWVHTGIELSKCWGTNGTFTDLFHNLNLISLLSGS